MTANLRMDSRIVTIIVRMKSAMMTRMRVYDDENLHVEMQLAQGQALMTASGHNGAPLFVIYPSALDPSHSVVVSGAQSLQAMTSAIQAVQQKMQNAQSTP